MSSLTLWRLCNHADLTFTEETNEGQGQKEGKRPSRKLGHFTEQVLRTLIRFCSSLARCRSSLTCSWCWRWASALRRSLSASSSARSKSIRRSSSSLRAASASCCSFSCSYSLSNHRQHLSHTSLRATFAISKEQNKDNGYTSSVSQGLMEAIAQPIAVHLGLGSRLGMLRLHVLHCNKLYG